MKSRVRAESTYSHLCNNSISKQQYSFQKQQRFMDPFARAKTILDKFYNIENGKSEIGGFFGKERRVVTQPNERSPSPQQYNPKMMQTKRNIFFSAGRSQCKLESIFYTTTLLYPGPGKYHPQQPKPQNSIYMGTKLKTQPNPSNSPGPIYSLPSTLIDKGKILSNYTKKGSIKIMLPTSKSRKIRNQFPNVAVQQGKNKKYLQEGGVFTYKGDKGMGKSGVLFSIEKQRRFNKDLTNKFPSPPYYRSFSEFIPPQSRTLKVKF